MTEVKKRNKMVFLHKEWDGYPVGTPFVLTPPTTAHLQARVMVGETNPMDRYVKLPCNTGEVIYVHYKEFREHFADVHPNCPSVTGPFVQNLVKYGADKLPTNVLALVSHEVNYPSVNFTICFNTDYLVNDDKDSWEKGSMVFKDYVPDSCVVKMGASTNDVTSRVVNCTIHRLIQLNLPDNDLVITEGW